jgi:hypothetical protein
MRCHEFERIWNERLDAASRRDARPGSPASSSARRVGELLDHHSASCPNCRRLAARFATLERALGTPYPLPRPSPQLASRVLSAVHEADLQPTRWQIIYESVDRRAVALFGCLAGITIMLCLMLPIVNNSLETAVARATASKDSPPLRTADNVSAPIPAPERAPTLHRAFANVTEATWVLARSASEPAASLGRDFLEVAMPDPFEVTAMPSVLPDSPSASSALERISGQLADGARPLSSAARRAFGFLSLPSIEKHPGRRGIAPAAKRA